MVTLYLAEVKTTDDLLPKRGPNTYDSGLEDAQKGYIKYGPKSTDQPNLIISNILCDENGDMILPGYYEVALSEDKKTMLLTQSQKLIATIPVFKVEDTRSKEQLAQPMDRKSQKNFDKEQKKKEKKNKKLIAKGKMLTEPELYNNASIEYDIKNDYYVIYYERGSIKAWGALKL